MVFLFSKKLYASNSTEQTAYKEVLQQLQPTLLS